MERIKNSFGHTTLKTQKWKEFNNDCTTRAFAFLFFKDDYGKAESYLAEHANKNKGDGTSYNNFMKVMQKESIGPKNISPMGEGGDVHSLSDNINSRTKEPCKMTVGAFVKKFSKGAFLIMVNGHVFSIKDGEIFGNNGDAKKLKTRIIKAWQIKWKY